MEQAPAFARTARAIRYLLAHRAARPSLTTLAAQLGVAPDVARRDFRRLVGLSPKRFQQLLLAGDAGALLDRGVDVLETSLAVGLSGPGRLHDHLVRIEALSPGEWKSRLAGGTMHWGRGGTPFGAAAVAWSGRGIHRLAFLDGDDADAPFLSALERRCRAGTVRADPAAAAALLERIFAVQRGRFDLQVLATPFQVAVWRALLDLHPGQTASYGAIAAALGRPTAARAVARAVADNPVALLIPCHRVLREDGGLGGYRWGTARKLGLLAAEQAGGNDSASG